VFSFASPLLQLNNNAFPRLTPGATVCRRSAAESRTKQQPQQDVAQQRDAHPIE
jgi:hypothetical protein